MSEINVTTIKNENADYGPNLVGYSTVTGDLNVTGSLRVGGGVTVSGITTFSDDINFDGNVSVGDSITLYAATGIITAAKYHGDGSELTNLPSSPGLGTALSEDKDSPLNVIYYTDASLAIDTTLTIDVPDSAKVAYTQYPQVVLNDGADLIVAPGDDFIPDILGIGTTGVGSGTLTGTGGGVRADNLRNRAGTGAPNASHGLIVTGVVTATSFDGNISGITGDVNIGGNLEVTGVSTTSNLVVANSVFTVISTTSTNKTIVNREYCTAVTGVAGTNANITITLPASPQPGWEVGVAVGGTFLDTLIARNGSNIMSLAEDMTLNREYIPVQLVYVDAAVGWRFF